MIVVPNIEEALKLLTEHEAFASQIETIWNVGGSEIYKIGLAHPWTHKLVLTRIEAEFEADVFFPKVPWDEYLPNDDFSPNETVEEKGVKWHVTSYTRKNTMFF